MRACESEREIIRRGGGKRERGEEMIYRPAIRKSRRGPHSGCLQRRASIGELSPAERDPHIQALVLAAAPTDAGLLQSVELSGELIFQRQQRRDGFSWHRPTPLPPPPPLPSATTTMSLHVDIRGGPRKLPIASRFFFEKRSSRFPSRSPRTRDLSPLLSTGHLAVLSDLYRYNCSTSFMSNNSEAFPLPAFSSSFSSRCAMSVC